MIHKLAIGCGLDVPALDRQDWLTRCLGQQGDRMDVLTGFETQEQLRELLQTSFAERKDYALAALVSEMFIHLRYEGAGKILNVSAVVARDRLKTYSPYVHEYWMIENSVAGAIACVVQGLLWEGEILKSCTVISIPSKDEDEYQAGLNNCFFKTESIITHDELRFRSRSEISIYNELSSRHILFFPNAAAVLGGEKKVLKREPDFLICHKGKLGILEVMGEGYHTQQTAVKDHDRARLFKQYGILCIEFFGADLCRFTPHIVVDRFLALLEKHRGGAST